MLRGVLDATMSRQFRQWSDAYEQAAARMAAELDSAPGYQQAGFLLFTRAHYAAAEGAFSSAVSIQPDDADGHYYLGQSLRQLGKLDRAEDAYREALRIDPGHGLARNALARIEGRS